MLKDSCLHVCHILVVQSLVNFSWKNFVRVNVTRGWMRTRRKWCTKSCGNASWPSSWLSSMTLLLISKHALAHLLYPDYLPQDSRVLWVRQTFCACLCSAHENA